MKLLKKTPIIHPNDIETLYNKINLAEISLFAGGYINFGYWENLKIESKISKKERALSSQRLYEKCFDLLEINKEDKILEVGCGLGNGCLLMQKYKPKQIIGLDSSYAQIQRAIQRHKFNLNSHKEIQFINAKAEKIPLSPQSITKVFSIEALHHFTSTINFLKSVYRILDSKGKLVIATIFFRHSPDQNFMNCFPNFSSGTDKVILIDEFQNQLIKCKFNNITIKSIGHHVWAGFNKWIEQTEYKETWDKYWIQAYEQGILDYFIIEAEKGVSSEMIK